VIEHYDRNWHGLSLEEVAQAAGIDPAAVANHHFYRAFYERLRQNGFRVASEWADQKRRWTPWVQRYLDQRRRETGSASRGISVGAGLGIVEEPLLSRGYDIVLHECQPDSFEYLRHRGVRFEQIIGTDLSSVASETFDVAFMLTISYVFPADGFVPVLRDVRRILRPGGLLVLAELLPPFSKLPIVTRTHRAGLRLLGRRRAPGVFWGWLRTAAEHRAALRQAGFTVEETLFLDDRGQRVSAPLLPFGCALPHSHAVSQWFVARR